MKNNQTITLCVLRFCHLSTSKNPLIKFVTYLCSIFAENYYKYKVGDRWNKIAKKKIENRKLIHNITEYSLHQIMCTFHLVTNIPEVFIDKSQSCNSRGQRFEAVTDFAFFMYINTG